MTTRRWAILWVTATALAAGCSQDPTQGYTLQSQYRPDIRTVAVDVFTRGKDIYRAGAAADILLWRNQVIRDMESRGVLSLDVFPEDMTATLVNRYLNIKARHLL